MEQAHALAEEQQRRAEEQAKAATRLRRGLIAAASFAAIAVAAFVVAIVLRGQAKQQTQIATSRGLAVAAMSHLSDQLDLALLLSVQASLTAAPETFEARRALLTGLVSSSPLTTFLFGHTDDVESVAFHPDGKVLASGSRDKTVRLWNVTTHQSLREPFISSPIGGDQRVWSVSFSPDGKTLASSSYQEILIWDVETGRPRRNALTNQNQQASAGSPTATFSPDGKTLASGRGKTILLWDVATGQPHGEPLSYPTDVRRVAFSSDGKILGAYGLGDNTIQLWEVQTGKPHGQPLSGHTGSVEGLAFSPDGKTVAAGGLEDNTIWLWDIETGQRRGQPLSDRAGVREIAFSPDGKILASVSTAGTIQLWDIETGQQRGQPLISHRRGRVHSVAFSPDGKTLASGCEDGAVILWDILGRGSLGESLPLHIDRKVAFSPDGKTLASASCSNKEDSRCTQGEIHLWDITTGQPRGGPLTGPIDEVRSLAFSPDGKTLASCTCRKTGASHYCTEGEIHLWDVRAQQPRGGPLTGPTDEVLSLAFSPDGKTLASGSCRKREMRGVAFACVQGEIHLWDVLTQQPRGGPLTFPSDEIKSLAFSPDGKTLASGGNYIILWDIKTGQIRGKLTRYIDSPEVFHLAFSPDGKILASAGTEDNVILWEVETGQPRGEPLARHSGGLTYVVQGLAFSPDGKTLAAGVTDGTLRLWDVPTQQPLGPPLPIERPLPRVQRRALGKGVADSLLDLFSSTFVNSISNLAFSSDGKTLISGDSNGTLLQWSIDIDSWRTRACRIANRNLSRAEWQQHVQDESYKKTCPNLPIDPSVVGPQ